VVTASPRTERSYRALLRVPGLPRILVSMQLSRIAQSMVGVTLVLFTLAEYHSPALTGIVTFVSVFPGLLVAPIAGALLDRHGRTRFVILDYAVALIALSAIGGLALAHALPIPVLLAITVVSSLTAILSNSGLRSLFPILVPERLWERVNAIDSNGYLIATILGPPIAAALVSVVGGATTMILIGILYGGATIAMIGAPDPVTETVGSARLLVAAWEGVRYTVGNATLRGLGVSISLLNLSGGMITIVVPLIAFADMHSAPAQRYYNLLCMAYGAHPQLFADLVEKKYLPSSRATDCQREYGEVAYAFFKLVNPHLDKDIARRVLQNDWLPGAKSKGKQN
jgi:MFS family permease